MSATKQKYNSRHETITMPEYGRHVQKMVEYAISLEDRVLRNRCARQIVRTMASLQPERRERPGDDQVYWDHLALIAQFRLDVDYPKGTITQERANALPERVPYTDHHIKYRYYGYHIEGMIKHVCTMPVGRERAMLEYFIATQMKRGYMTWNNEVVEDLRIFQDLYALSEGQIMLTPENCKIIINPNTIDRGGKQRVSKKQAGRVMSHPRKK